MDLPMIEFEGAGIFVNLTIVASVLIFCLTAATSIIRIWGRGKNAEQYPGKSPYCKQEEDKTTRIEKRLDENKKKMESIQDITLQMEKEVAVLKNETTNMNKTMDEMKQNSKEVAQRLDDLLKQLLEWMSE